MESMGKKKPRRPRRSFTSEFEAEIVGLCRRGDRSVGQVARDFELTETAGRDWVKQAEVDAGERNALTSGDARSLPRCGGRIVGCPRMSTSSSGPQLSSRRRPGDGAPVHRGGEACRSQRQTGV
ncbi:transposase [Streptomyces sp. NPDC005794]|uniref:transposase n=1 Tax=Streptomyces sp. NPDC005794 TaxID=3364733 RepID=UPI0036C74079